jgi:thiamine monophosphate synthase
MPPFRLLAITPPAGPVPADSLEPWRGVAGELAVLLREPGRPAAEILAEDGRLAPLRRRCRAAGVPMLLSVDLEDLANLSTLPADLSGVQLRGDPDREARVAARGHLGRLRPAHATWLGRSCHGAPQPGHEHVDYTLFAPVFTPTTTQPGRPPGSKIPAGLAALAAWAAAPGACIFALGGVGRATAGACLAAGARGLAGSACSLASLAGSRKMSRRCGRSWPRTTAHVEPLSPR